MPTTIVNTTTNTTPDAGQGGTAVASASNTGHGGTTSTGNNGSAQTKTCIWTGFSSVAGTITSVTLKADWTQDGTMSDGGVSTTNQFTIDYSLNGGSSWTSLRNAQQIQASTSGTSSASLPAAQDLTQVQVRDALISTSVVGETVTLTASVSNIRIEVITEDASAAIGRQPIVMM